MEAACNAALTAARNRGAAGTQARGSAFRRERSLLASKRDRRRSISANHDATSTSPSASRTTRATVPIVGKRWSSMRGPVAAGQPAALPGSGDGADGSAISAPKACCRSAIWPGLDCVVIGGGSGASAARTRCVPIGGGGPTRPVRPPWRPRPASNVPESASRHARGSRRRGTTRDPEPSLRRATSRGKLRTEPSRAHGYRPRAAPRLFVTSSLSAKPWAKRRESWEKSHEHASSRRHSQGFPGSDPQVGV